MIHRRYHIQWYHEKIKFAGMVENARKMAGKVTKFAPAVTIKLRKYVLCFDGHVGASEARVVASWSGWR